MLHVASRRRSEAARDSDTFLRMPQPPVSVTHGWLGAVPVRVPWRSLGGEPMLFSITSLTLLPTPLASSADGAEAVAREAVHAARDRARGARRVGSGPRGGGRRVVGRRAGRQAHAPAAADARGERAARARAARHRRRRARAGVVHRSLHTADMPPPAPGRSADRMREKASPHDST